MSNPRHVFQVYIRTSPERLWEAITKPEFTRRYFHQTDIASDWEQGSAVCYRNQDGSVAVEGEVLEVERPRRLSFTWHVLYDPEAAKDRPSRVTWEIEPLGETCKLTLTHDEFDGETKLYLSVGEGWPAILSNLKSLLETGQPLDVS